jgi:polysaccharide pyruvyl transferase WcaK-like protein
MLWGRPGESPFERTIADAKVVVSKGGYVFVERDTIGGLLALWFTAFPLIYAARRNVPTVALCTTVGPYRRFLSRALCRWILKRIDTVVTRDPISTAEAARLGCRDVRECPDIVMTFDESRIDFRYPQEQLRSAGVYGVVVISSETRKLDEVFLERLGALTERILRDGLVDRLVLTVQSMEDARITSRFLRSQNDPRYILVEDDLSPEESMGIYKGARFLIGRRLHAGLFALLGGTPIVLFSTDGVKTDGVMRELGLSNRVDRYPDFSVDEVHRLLVTMTQREEEEKEIVGKRVEEARRRAVAKLSALGRQLQAETRSTGTAGELIL